MHDASSPSDDSIPEESAEYDWLVIDTALDCIMGLAVALGPSFAQLFKIFEKPIFKFASSSLSIERSTSVGVLGECIRGMGSAVTPSTDRLYKILSHRLTDEDAETKSNAAFGMGLLIENTEDAKIISSFPEVLRKLEPLLQTDEKRCCDNAAGCVSRMIMKDGGSMPLEMVLPALVDILPLKEDWEENEVVWGCMVGLCTSLLSHFHPTSSLAPPLPSPSPPALLFPSHFPEYPITIDHPVSVLIPPHRLNRQRHPNFPNAPTPTHPRLSPQPPRRAA